MHIICSSNVSQTDLVDALYQAQELLEKYKSGSVSSWDIMGLAIEAYRHVMLPSLPCYVNVVNLRKIGASSKVEIEAELLQTRWQMAHDLCSLVACNIMFQDCREGEGYDLSWFFKLTPFC